MRELTWQSVLNNPDMDSLKMKRHTDRIVDLSRRIAARSINPGQMQTMRDDFFVLCEDCDIKTVVRLMAGAWKLSQRQIRYLFRNEIKQLKNEEC
jgi:hypothetical protein